MSKSERIKEAGVKKLYKELEYYWRLTGQFVGRDGREIQHMSREMRKSLLLQFARDQKGFNLPSANAHNWTIKNIREVTSWVMGKTKHLGAKRKLSPKTKAHGPREAKRGDLCAMERNYQKRRLCHLGIEVSREGRDLSALERNHQKRRLYHLEIEVL